MNYVVDNWSFDPFVIVVALVVMLHELGPGQPAAPVHGPPTPEAALALTALLRRPGLLLVAVTSPVDYWADDYFFVHMVEHIMIAFYAPMLIVAGAPWLPLAARAARRVPAAADPPVLLGAPSRGACGPSAGSSSTRGRRSSRSTS